MIIAFGNLSEVINVVPTKVKEVVEIKIERYEQLNLRVSEDVKEKFKVIAKNENISNADLIEKLVNSYNTEKEMLSNFEYTSKIFEVAIETILEKKLKYIVSILNSISLNSKISKKQLDILYSVLDINYNPDTIEKYIENNHLVTEAISDNYLNEISDNRKKKRNK